MFVVTYLTALNKKPKAKIGPWDDELFLKGFYDLFGHDRTDKYSLDIIAGAKQRIRERKAHERMLRVAAEKIAGKLALKKIAAAQKKKRNKTGLAFPAPLDLRGVG